MTRGPNARSRWSGSAALVLAVVLSGCSTPEAADDGLEKERVQRTLAAIIAADNAGDLDAAVDLYTEDAVLLPPGGRPIQGRAAIRDHYAALFRDVSMDVRFESVETRIMSAWAFDRGRTRGRVIPASGEPPRTLNDTYLMLLRRDEDGTWRIARLIWNGGPPADG